eukprot:TRINITY_DN10683_c0_g3_i2.p1 TRINITY_DN10683_c0_g3~~TRINITY_DN10683_c0_g3_i2.p1  ORF type:complete len:457 (-),score=92.91 TRINITY_DN10683_c0_g3_i2:66-1436(-)
MFPCFGREAPKKDDNKSPPESPREEKNRAASAKRVDPWTEPTQNMHKYLKIGIDDSTKIPKLKLKLGFTSPESLVSFYGPDPENEGSVNYNGDVYAKSSSTYPINIKKKQRCDREGVEFNGEKMGDPICDSFGIHIHPSLTLLAVADGCNWGSKPCEAAHNACRFFLEYVSEKLIDEKHSIQTVKQLTFYILRAFAATQTRILEVPQNRGQDIFGTGTTTLLGAAVAKVSSEELGRFKSKWIFIALSLGDCKAFLYKQQEDIITDITQHSRPNESDVSDPGGRLGPSNKDGDPDLRNLAIFLSGCEENDIVFLLSDGVYDNFDPEFLGLRPKEVNLDVENWKDADKEESHKARLLYRNTLLLDVVKAGKKTVEVTPELITNNLMEHCKTVTKLSRRWVKENPDARMPNDRTQFKGKMDHVTCAAARVGTLSQEEGESSTEETLSTSEDEAKGKRKV